MAHPAISSPKPKTVSVFLAPATKLWLGGRASDRPLAVGTANGWVFELRSNTTASGRSFRQPWAVSRKATAFP
jgi:hypothetical protein